MQLVPIAGQGQIRKPAIFLILSRLFHIFLKEYVLLQSLEKGKGEAGV